MSDLTVDESLNPWTQLSRREIYDNPWIRVTEDQVLNPSGKPGIYGLVHMKTIATGVIAVADDGRIPLVGQYRYALGRYSWEIPEGGASFAEGAEAGIRRELQEEAGCLAAHWLELGRIDTSNSIVNESGVYFVAWSLSFCESEPEETEQLALRWLPWPEVVAMVMEGGITDSTTVAAVLKLELLRARQALPGELLAKLNCASVSTAPHS